MSFWRGPSRITSSVNSTPFASDKSPALKDGGGCAGDTSTDPVGATFDEIYTHQFFYVIWNDQFYGDPAITGCSDSCSGPWGHSKGMLVWNEAGEGLVMQVTTPSWPASGSSARPRRSDGNSLGCVEDDNVKVSQHFFSLRLNKQDILKVLMALDNASVVTDVRNHQIANIGGPEEIQQLAGNLGHKSDSVKFTRAALSSGVQLISKPSRLHLPPWQMVSAVLGGVSLRTATWWAAPKIYSTNRSTPIPCWDESLGKPGAISIATTGSWHGQSIGLTGGPGDNSNHAKIGGVHLGQSPVHDLRGYEPAGRQHRRPVREQSEWERWGYSSSSRIVHCMTA